MTDRTDLVVIGAGVIGAASAYFAARAGLQVTVLDRGPIAGGTSSAGEGNILVSDKEEGPELDLAQYSQAVWRDELAPFAGLWEFEDKGGLVVARTESSLENLTVLARRQAELGIVAQPVDSAGLHELEPALAPGMAGGVFYPQDCQVQPMLVVAHLLRMARELGAVVRTGVEVTGVTRQGNRLTGVRTTAGEVAAPMVLNAAGTWSSQVAELAGSSVPVLPRRGFVLVTEPLPVIVRRKVYAAEYVADVGSSAADLQTSPVVEGTKSGTILIGSSRERVGFDRTVSLPVLSALAAAALQLFPVLAGVRVMRSYLGFRPYCPDHLPVIGPDPTVRGLWHASGHEGAGIGLSAGTGKLIAQALSGATPDLDLAPFAPARFSATVSV